MSARKGFVTETHEKRVNSKHEEQEEEVHIGEKTGSTRSSRWLETENIQKPGKMMA